MVGFQDDTEFDEFRNLAIQTIFVAILFFVIIFWSGLIYLIFS